MDRGREVEGEGRDSAVPFTVIKSVRQKTYL